MVSHRIPEQKIESISELLECIKKDTKSIKEPIWFRGHRNQNWKLVPSIFRGNSTKKEIDYLREFKQDGTLLVKPLPSHQYEWLFIMRHHNIPTRLLDWTESPLVAAYFITTNLKSIASGAIWAFLPLTFNKNIVELEERSSLPSFEEDDEYLKSYNPLIFETSVVSSPPIAFLAPRNSSRMQAQLSVFTIHHQDKTAIDKIGDGKHVWKYVIPHSAKKKIAQELKILKINRFQLYPELESIYYKIKGEN